MKILLNKPTISEFKGGFGDCPSYLPYPGNRQGRHRNIAKIVDDRMEKLQRRLRMKKYFKDRLWNMLVERSEGIFLWVLLSIKQLDRARGLTVQKLEALMQGLPKGLDGIYDRMLEALENDPHGLALARKMLGRVILAPRPLTIPEFREAMAVQESSYSVDSIQEHLMFNVSRDIRTICGSFLEVVSRTGDPKMITIAMMTPKRTMLTKTLKRQSALFIS